MNAQARRTWCKNVSLTRRMANVVRAITAILLFVVMAVAGGTARTTPSRDEAAQAPPPSAAAQAPARDTPGPRIGTARIRGRVLAADTGTPVRRASVEITGLGVRYGDSTMTDGEGRYEFRELPPGSYSLSASKTGFLPGRPGGTKPGDVGKPVRVEEGQVATAEDVKLTRAGAIAGRVVDEFGDPVAKVQVRVMRSQSLGTTRRMVGASYASTNDLGQYRVFDLPPGIYVVAADTTRSEGGLRWRAVSDRTTYAPTYYPGTANFSEAGSVQVTAGQEIAGVDVPLALVSTFRISGIALDTRGRAAVGSVVFAYRPGGFGEAPFGTTVEPDGSFLIRQVPVGDYVVEMVVSPDRPVVDSGALFLPRHYGRVRISVADHNIEGLTIQTSAGATVSGQVVFEGAPVPPGSRSKLSVMPARVPLSSDSIGPFGSAPEQSVRIAADGSFLLTNLYGERVMRIDGLPSGWTLKAVYENGRETTDTPFTFEGREQVTGVQIVVTDRVTHLTVTVTDDGDRPGVTGKVLVFPEDLSKAGPATRFQRTTDIEDGKTATIDALPPAAYVAVALGSLPTDIYDPNMLDGARKVGLRFSLKEGETKQIALKLVPSLETQ